MSITKDVNLDKNYNILPFSLEGDIYFSIGVKAFQKHDFPKAIKWFQKAIEMDPSNPLYQCQLSVLYTEIRSYHKANQLLTEVIQKFGEEYVDCYYLIANNCAHLGLFQDAQKNVEKYLEKAPSGDFSIEAEELLEMLKLYNEEDDVEDEYEDEWLFDEEDELLIYQETVFYHIENQEWDQALPVLEEMMMLYPDYVVAKHDFAFALFFSGDEQEAIDLELECFKQDPNSIHSIVNLAIFYDLIGDEEESAGYIEMLKKVYPINEQQGLKIATTFARTGHFQLALERFRTLPKARLHQHISYYKWYSVTCLKCGLEKQAADIWKEGCKRHPFLQKIGDIKNV